MNTKFFSVLLCLFAIKALAVPPPVYAPREYDFIANEEIKVSVPLKPLASGAIEIRSLSGRQRFTEWNRQDHSATYDFLQRFAHCCSTPYTVYGKTTPALRAEMFSWQIIPKSGLVSGTWATGQTFYRSAFGAPTEKHRDSIAQEEWHKQLKTAMQNPVPLEKEASPPSDDPFCTQAAIDQQVWEGRTIRVLKDYSKNRLMENVAHFLVVPKQHRTEFADISEEEYTEAMETTGKLSRYFEGKYPKSTLHFYHNNGAEAGQTVPHWHLHIVVIPEDKMVPSQDFPCTKSPTSCTRIQAPIEHVSQKAAYLFEGCKQLICLGAPRRILDKDELEEEVAYWRAEFKQYL